MDVGSLYCISNGPDCRISRGDFKIEYILLFLELHLDFVLLWNYDDYHWISDRFQYDDQYRHVDYRTLLYFGLCSVALCSLLPAKAISERKVRILSLSGCRIQYRLLDCVLVFLSSFEI